MKERKIFIGIMQADKDTVNKPSEEAYFCIDDKKVLTRYKCDCVSGYTKSELRQKIFSVVDSMLDMYFGDYGPTSNTVRYGIKDCPDLEVGK